jgi:RNA polymerase sigma factor (sigma-70 family)
MQAEKDNERTDAELLIECKNGSKKAWEALIRRFQRLIFTIPRRAGLSEDQAADVFQIVFSRAYEHLGSISQPERIQAWLVTTAKRETLAILRQSKRTISISTDDDDEDAKPFDIEDESPLPPAPGGGRTARSEVAGVCETRFLARRPAPIQRGGNPARHQRRQHRPHPHTVHGKAACDHGSH